MTSYADQESAEKPCDVSRRTSMRRRIDAALMAHEHATRRAEAALRAKQIIDAHPEFAELLDLIQEF